MPSTTLLTVAIVRFVDAAQPGWVACEFTDAGGRLHTLVDKAPVFTATPLDGASVYPQPGVAACEPLARWRDERGRELLRVTTRRPFGIESTEGLDEFVVFADQLS
jgi:hypothetical protein